MSDTANDLLIQTVIDRMWMVHGNIEYWGLSPYEVARKLGLNHVGAKKVDELWDGPEEF